MKTAILPLALACLLLAPAALPQGQNKAKSFHYDTAEPKIFKSVNNARAWLNRYGVNGYRLETDVVIVKESEKAYRILPVAALRDPKVTHTLIFRSGG